VYAYLTFLSGDRAGDYVLLNPAIDVSVGRGSECQLALADPLASRVHAMFSADEGQWVVRDMGSRNGTYVNGQRIDEATLAAGHEVCVGETCFEFQLSDQPPTSGTQLGPALQQTIVQDVPMGSSMRDSLPALPDAEQVQELMLLYQLCIKLLGIGEPSEVIRASLELIRSRTGAAIAGFLWASDDGQLKPKLVLPQQAAAKLAMNATLTELVAHEGHAIWVANQPSAGESLDSFADAICVPLIKKNQPSGERTILGALHVYLEDGRFRQSEFDFVITVANLVTIALVRAREQVSLQTEHDRLLSHTVDSPELIGQSEPMLALKNKINRVARAAGCVLVRGESGSGKELVARAIHKSSPRKDRPLVCVNCAAIPAELMESQLFGHKAGSFTGADRDHTGFFQQADLGTLFLDEVGEMPLEGQAKLLRILEGHPFLPVGGIEEISVDVRVVAATNRDLAAYVKEGKFREDLYYRLTVFELVVPPLRERGSDIELLVEFFLDHFRKQHGRPRLALADDARRKLLAYRWPGNVRQLRNRIDSAVVMTEGNEISAADLALRDASSEVLETLEIDHWERKLIVEALTRSAGNVPEAAKLLGIGRATLYRKIEQYHIER
jgi:Nif-specific regulatory protein